MGGTYAQALKFKSRKHVHRQCALALSRPAPLVWGRLWRNSASPRWLVFHLASFPCQTLWLRHKESVSHDDPESSMNHPKCYLTLNNVIKEHYDRANVLCNTVSFAQHPVVKAQTCPSELVANLRRDCGWSWPSVLFCLTSRTTKQHPIWDSAPIFILLIRLCATDRALSNWQQKVLATNQSCIEKHVRFTYL